jgi:hypothetical protein
MKTRFAPGVIITTRFLNGSQNIKFDDRDEDWSYPRLTPASLNIPAMGRVFVTLTEDQVINGLKEYVVLPESSASATEPNQFVTLKDIEGNNGFLRLFCADPQTGNLPIYNASESRWECSDTIDGGSF